MAPLPRSVKPMKAVLGDGLPHDDPDEPAWAYELKWDGMRILAYVDPDADPEVRLESSNGRDVTASFPELAGLIDASCGKPAIFDGEAVAFADGRPSFGRLQQRMHLTKATEVALRQAEVPVFYEIFDLLFFDGTDTTSLAYDDRRRLLEALLEQAADGEGEDRPDRCWALSSSHDDGAALYQAAEANQLEGVMAKRRTSPYEPGKRSRNWLKVKVRLEQELVVGGWLSGEGARSDRIGALLVGYHDPDAPGSPLRYAGRVGTGFSDGELTRLGALLDERAHLECPFNPPPPVPVTKVAHWVRPDLVAQVAFGEWTSDGILRHPAYLGQREDKAAADVVRESPVPSGP
jgi:bifunctional non-homologous end joining protein LigD